MRSRKRVNRSEKIFRLAFQLLIIIWVPFLVDITAFLGSTAPNPSGTKQWVSLLTVFVLYGVLAVITVVSLLKWKKGLAVETGETGKEEKSKKGWILSAVCIFILLTATFALRVPMIGTLPRWDSGEYFYRLGTQAKNFDYTLSSFIYTFTTCRHANYAFNFCGVLTIFFDARNHVLLGLTQIILSEIAILIIYKVLRRRVGFTPVQAAFGAFAASMPPIFYGFSVYFTPDYYVILFFLFALYFEEKGFHIVEAMMMILMCFTKESSCLVVLGYYGFRMLHVFAKTDGSFGKKVAAMFKSYLFRVAISVGILFVGFYKGIGIEWVKEWDFAFMFGKDGLIVNKRFIFLKTVQYVVTNFAWVVSLIAAVSIIIVIIREIVNKKKAKNADDTVATVEETVAIEAVENGIKEKIESLPSSFVAGFFGGMLIFALFGISFHVSAFERYDTFFAPCLVILMAISIRKAFKGSKVFGEIIYYGAIILVSVLLYLETYKTIDPVTKALFTQVNIGDGETMNFENETSSYYGDGLLTNYEYSWIDKAFNGLMQEMDYNSDKVIYMPYDQTTVTSGVFFVGNGGVYHIGWDENKKTRVFMDSDQENVSAINFQYVDDYEKYFPYKDIFYNGMVSGELKDTGVLTSLPFVDDEYELARERVGLYYYLGERDSVKAMNGTLSYYPLLKKDAYLDTISANDLWSIIENDTCPYTEKDMEIARGLLDGDEDAIESFREYVDEVYRYKLGTFVTIDSEYEKTDDSIEDMDSIIFDYKLYDSDGSIIDECDGYGCTVGGYGIMDPIDDALLDMKIGEERDVDFVFPYGQLGLEEYGGHEVTIHLAVKAFACKFYMYANEDEMQVQYNLAYDEVWSYFRDMEEYIVLYDAVQSGDTDCSEEELSEVTNYFDEYVQDLGISEDEFLSDYAGLTYEEFESCQITFAACAEEIQAVQDRCDEFYYEYK